MSVFAVFEVMVDPAMDPAMSARYAEYRAAVPALIERFGGRYLVRAGTGRAIEGAPTDGRWHIVEFPDLASAEAFWSCPEYAALKPLRDGAADVRAVLISPPSSPGRRVIDATPPPKRGEAGGARASGDDGVASPPGTGGGCNRGA